MTIWSQNVMVLNIEDERSAWLRHGFCLYDSNLPIFMKGIAGMCII